MDRTHSVPPTRSIFRNEWPLIPLVLLGALFLFGGGALFGDHPSNALLMVQFCVVLCAILCGVFAVLRHADAISHRLGDPLGTLILTLAVISIEVALVVAMMAGGAADSTAARDTMFAVVMITMNLMLGLCLISGGARFGQSSHNLHGASSFLGVLVLLGTLSLVFPRLTTSAPGGQPSSLQAWFLIGVSCVCYGVFLLLHTGQMRGWFQDQDSTAMAVDHAVPTVGRSSVFLVIYILLIVCLAETMAHSVETLLTASGLPRALGGLLIALIVLAPEGLSGYRAASLGQMQRAVNLCVGSALSTIGLTVPMVLVASFFLGHPVDLGLESTEIMLLALTFLLAGNTLSTGRTSWLHGVLHVSLFIAFLVLMFDV
ncbi:MAG: calcium:proton antiporter [Planctomycetota bacterium]|nr:calcium:proton antiporter [Planctomycetota bacterium]